MKSCHIIASNDALLRRLLQIRNNAMVDSESDDDTSSYSEESVAKNQNQRGGLSLVDQFRKETPSSAGEFSVESSEQYSESVLSDKHNKKLRVHYNKALNKRSPDPNASPAGSLQRKKKKKRKGITICTENCRYEVVRQVAFKFGMKDVSEDDSWDLYWTDSSVSVERAKEMKRFQKINHFPGMGEISRKDLLARNLNRMLRMFPNEYNFFPKTWCLPADYSSIFSYARKHKNRTYICKPEVGSQGRGIFITKSIKDIKPYEKMICQVYIAKPFLVDGFKFDLRVYVLITSCDPLRIFVYNDGLVRFATSRYQEPNSVNVTNVFMHLTNYAVNKHSRTFVKDNEAGSKRKISTLNKWFEDNKHDVREIWSGIDDVIVKTVIAALPIVKHNYHTCFPNHDFTYACFELLGFDILLDHKLKPYILEVNHSPSYHTETKVDRDIKESLIMDTFRILNLAQTDKKKIMEEDRQRIRDRLLQGIFQQKDGNSTSTIGVKSISSWEMQKQWEDKHMGNFRCVYPSAGYERYDMFFYQNKSSLYQNTAASRAREECARIQREELEEKIREEASRRKGHKISKGPAPESPTGKENHQTKILEPLKSKKLIQANQQARYRDKEGYVLNSFTAQSIVEKEERERKLGLMKRDFLIRSNKVKDVVEQVMIRNGALSKTALMSYGLYGKSSDVQQDPHTWQSDPSSKKLPSIIVQPQILPKNQDVNMKYTSLSQVVQTTKESILTKSSPPIVSIESLQGLMITSNHAPVEIRPLISNIFTESGKSKFRDTKTQLARSFTNNIKIKNLERREQNPFHPIR